MSVCGTPRRVGQSPCQRGLAGSGGTGDEDPPGPDGQRVVPRERPHAGIVGRPRPRVHRIPAPAGRAHHPSAVHTAHGVHDTPAVCTSCPSVRGLVPAAPVAHRHLQRHRQLVRRAHLPAHQLLDRARARRPRPRSTSSSWTCSSIRLRSPLGLQRPVARSSIATLMMSAARALDRGVERHPLGHLAALAVVRC